jgi:hypothetical protein
MRTESLWVAETADILGKQVHERETGLAYDITAIIETGKCGYALEAEFAGTSGYMVREREVLVYLKSAPCPAVG